MTSNSELKKRYANCIPNGLTCPNGIFVDRAKNSELWDIDGNRYVDFAGGIGALNTGHCHDVINTAIEKQLHAFGHTAFQVTAYEVYIQLAEQLNQIAPGNTPKKTILLNTGSEAIENAVKIARCYTKRQGLIAFTGGFHGRTLTALSLTGKTIPYKQQMGNLPGDIYHTPYPYPYRNISVDMAIAGIEHIFKTEIAPNDVAAILLEPIQGEGGFLKAPNEFMQYLRKLCDEHGILLIADEVQTGFARSGKMFAIEHTGVEPDLMTVAKSLAGGMPLSALIGKANIMDSAPPGSLGSTYAGHPLSCAASLAVLDIIKQENLCERATIIGQTMHEKLKQFQQQSYGRHLGEIRQHGAMVAVELVCDQTSREPAPELLTQFRQQALHRGLLVLSSGLYGNVIRTLVPLITKDELLEEGLDLFEATLKSLFK